MEACPVHDFLAIAKALSDENRVRILLALRRGELCVCRLIDLLGLAPSTVSRHMAVLKQAGLVDLRRDGRWIWYRLAGERGRRKVRRALEWVFECVGTSERARRDKKRLKEILKIDREERCKVLKTK